MLSGPGFAETRRTGRRILRLADFRGCRDGQIISQPFIATAEQRLRVLQIRGVEPFRAGCSGLEPGSQGPRSRGWNIARQKLGPGVSRSGEQPLTKCLSSSRTDPGQTGAPVRASSEDLVAMMIDLQKRYEAGEDVSRVVMDIAKA